MNICFAKHEGLAAKHLPRENEKAMQINDADVAELVDARDLKSLAPIDKAQNSFKTNDFGPVKTAPNPCHLQNILEGARQNLGALIRQSLVDLQEARQ